MNERVPQPAKLPEQLVFRLVWGHIVAEQMKQKEPGVPLTPHGKKLPILRAGLLDHAQLLIFLPKSDLALTIKGEKLSFFPKSWVRALDIA